MGSLFAMYIDTRDRNRWLDGTTIEVIMAEVASRRDPAPPGNSLFPCPGTTGRALLPGPKSPTRGVPGSRTPAK